MDPGGGSGRHHGLPKVRCQFVCQRYPQGLALRSQESCELFTLNGIQTLSGACYDLRREIGTMRRMGVTLARLSPRAEGMAEIVNAFDQARHGRLAPRTRWPWWIAALATATGMAGRAWSISRRACERDAAPWLCRTYCMTYIKAGAGSAH
ncbi:MULTISPECIES: hypothetical protein [Halomonadaceae]|uniref:hypothetical protein n=1 Tax=Halomonadaceae TaxID=28256 RepID=UPI00200F4C0C|nr:MULTISPECIES: hypothetical protein [Halomonas]